MLPEIAIFVAHVMAIPQTPPDAAISVSLPFRSARRMEMRSRATRKNPSGRVSTRNSGTMYRRNLSSRVRCRGRNQTSTHTSNRRMKRRCSIPISPNHRKLPLRAGASAKDHEAPVPSPSSSARRFMENPIASSVTPPRMAQVTTGESRGKSRVFAARIRVQRRLVEPEDGTPGLNPITCRSARFPGNDLVNPRIVEGKSKNGPAGRLRAARTQAGIRPRTKQALPRYRWYRNLRTSPPVDPTAVHRGTHSL